jgi:hypothetical protein
MTRIANSLQVPERIGGDDGTRTRGLCRDSLGISVLSATYVLSGDCQVAERDCRNRSLWVNLWVRVFRARRSWSGALNFKSSQCSVSYALASAQVDPSCHTSSVGSSPPRYRLTVEEAPAQMPQAGTRTADFHFRRRQLLRGGVCAPRRKDRTHHRKHA